jgi:hypothetical protein
VPYELRATLPADEAGPWIVQFQGPLTLDDQKRLRRTYRLALTEYIPDSAYLEVLAPAVRAKLPADELVRAIVPYEPAYKIAPLVGERVFRSDERREIDGLWLNVVLFDQTDPKAIARRVDRLTGVSDLQVIDDRPIGGSLQLRFIAHDSSVIARMAALPEVRVIDEVPEPNMDDANAAGTLQSGTPGTQSVWSQGLHGEGQVIGVLDSNTLDMAHCFFQDPGMAAPGPAHRKVLAVRNAAGRPVGDHHTFVAGLAAGDDFNSPGTTVGRGSAYNARLVSGTTADIASGSMLAELTAAAASGATIHTNSWHDDDHGAGNPAPYNQTAVDVDSFTWNNEDHLVLGSAGNTNEEQGAPGTAKNAICCGAAQADPNEMNLGDGNPGPTLDNRRKPDLVAPGCNLTSANDGTACGTTTWGGVCATSWATPTAAGAAALVRQYFCDGWYPTGTQEPHHSFAPSGALIKAVLLNGTLDMTGVADYPNNTEGWGLLRLEDVLAFSGSALSTRVWDFRNADGLNTGQQREHHIDVASNAQRLKVTLVWTEPPGAVNAMTAIVNDLDLEVVSPGGAQLFLGNVFAAGVSTTGGAADTGNNIECVLINAPAAGDWTIRVRATAVNVGNPGQGYALVATADLTDPPVTTGTQDTLVVRVTFADIGASISLANLQATMIDLADYIDEVSYGQATVVPLYRGVIALAQNRDYYFHPTRNPLIELTEEVTAALAVAEPNLFDTIERMIIVTNDASLSGDWATTGPWPYTLPAGFTRPISVSIQGYQNPLARFTHGMLHQFGLVDLYAHEGVVFPRPYVDDWDNMGGTYDNVHPLIWSKERAGWPAAHGDTVTFIPRPAPGASYGGPNPLRLFHNHNQTANRKAIAIGLTQGAATVAAENAFYYIEARGDAGVHYDSGLPAGGVLIYHVNELVPQGEGPVILRDENLVTLTLDDASYEVGDVVTLPGTGITITVLAGTGGAPFDIQVDYTAPVTDYNLSITRGDTINSRFYDWFSPDIWVDSPKNGWNQGSGPLPHDQREQPVAGMVNRLYARFRNAGPATAFDFDVRFRISEPYHTVGGEADFDRFVGMKHITSLGVGESIEYVDWTPATGGTHVCLKVDLINLVGTDTNPNDNWAQENLETVTSVTASPFHPVTYSYNLTNPYDIASLFYFRAEGVPDGWEVDLLPRKIRLAPGERITGQATITPPKDAEVCTSEWIAVTSWAPRGDTLIRVGGGVVQVDLRRPTVIDLTADAMPCKGNDLEWLFEQLKRAGEQFDPETVRRDCVRISSQGCLEPPVAGVEIILKYVDPLGNVTYHTVLTDANGCYEDFMVSTTPGNWQVEAEYPGSKCDAPGHSRPVVVCWCR